MYFLRPGTRRFASNIKQISASRFHDERVLDRARGIKKFSAIRKTIRCDVEHAHNERPLAQHERSGRELDPENFSANHSRSSLARGRRKKITQRSKRLSGSDSLRMGRS